MRLPDSHRPEPLPHAKNRREWTFPAFDLYGRFRFRRVQAVRPQAAGRGGLFGLSPRRGGGVDPLKADRLVAQPHNHL